MVENILYKLLHIYPYSQSNIWENKNSNGSLKGAYFFHNKNNIDISDIPSPGHFVSDDNNVSMYML